MGGDTLDERYEQKMARLEQIKNAGYRLEVQWECEFDKDILPQHPQLKNNPLIQQSPLNIRDALYGGRTATMSLHHQIGEGETIQYCDVMSLIRISVSNLSFP
jgi:hypothetical protein